jgi:Divergent InlB B-repeat domain
VAQQDPAGDGCLKEGVAVMRVGLRAVVLLIAAGALVGAFASAAQAAPWCGSPTVEDRAAIVTGRSIRVLYVIPSDGADRTAELSPRISSDIDEITAWWRSQDPEREPRFDRAAFPCGQQADIMTLRLPDSAAAIRPGDVRFNRIASAAEASGSSAYAKQLVYYDGPTDDDQICGQGGGSPDASGVAVVYLANCTDVPTAAVAAHELLHAFGALATSGPPSACPDTRDHPCDSETDVLYPYAGTSPLTSLVLDFGRNDYYGHTGAWLDAQDSGWLRLVNRQVAFALGITGRGSVESDVPGIDCSSTCTTEWDAGTAVSLEALPAAGQRFVRWSGACRGSLNCDVALSAAASVGALFAPERFGIVVSVSGKGAVAGAGAACRVGRCPRQATSYVALRLRATAAKGWRFAGWTGACRGRAAVCTVSMTRATSVGGRFVRS